MMWSKARQVFLRQSEQFNGGPQSPAMFGMRRVLEILLQMHKCARGLNQSFEEIIVIRVGVQPKLLENIVRFVVASLIPTAKEGAIKWIIRHFAGRVDIIAFELAHELRNPLAFVHVGLNLTELR